MATTTPSDFPSEETFRAELVSTLTVASRLEVANALEKSQQGVGLWDRGKTSPPARQRASLIRKLQALKSRKSRTGRAK